MTPKPFSRADLRPLGILIAALLVARIMFVVLMPAVYSKDLFSWLHVMDVLQSGGNPYGTTEVLNWPPFWMQILFVIHHFCKHTGLNPIPAIQTVLVFGEVIVLCAAYVLGRRWLPAEKLFKPLLLGLAINPVSMFLSLQHCNYDVFVGLFILLGSGMVMLWNESRKPEHWLAACFFAGLGILAKTVPVMIVPLLFMGIRQLPWSTRIFGIALVATPFVIGISVLFSLEPHGAMHNVIGYRSMGGWYGFSGLLWTMNQGGLLRAFQTASPIIMIGVLLFATWKSYHSPIVTGPIIIARATLLMMFVSTFGPGYSPPYVLWSLPMLVMLYAAASKGLGRLLLLGFVVMAGTYTVEYAFFDSHGAFIKSWWHWEKVQPICDRLGSRPFQTMIRLPMFVLYLVTFFKLLRNARSASVWPSEAHLQTTMSIG